MRRIALIFLFGCLIILSGCVEDIGAWDSPVPVYYGFNEKNYNGETSRDSSCVLGIDYSGKLFTIDEDVQIKLSYGIFNDKYVEQYLKNNNCSLIDMLIHDNSIVSNDNRDLEFVNYAIYLNVASELIIDKEMDKNGKLYGSGNVMHFVTEQNSPVIDDFTLIKTLSYEEVSKEEYFYSKIRRPGWQELLINHTEDLIISKEILKESLNYSGEYYKGTLFIHLMKTLFDKNTQTYIISAECSMQISIIIKSYNTDVYRYCFEVKSINNDVSNTKGYISFGDKNIDEE